MSGTLVAPRPLGPSQIAALLEATLAIVAEEMRALGAEAAWRPAPGEWCANEVVGHVIEAENRGFAGRIRTILAEDRPRLAAWDQPSIAAARNDCARPPDELVAELTAMRRASVELVRGLRDADLQRVGIHPHVGDLTVGDLIAEWVHHDRNHVRQLLANGQARVWPQMGNAQRFEALDA
ncbi:MAG TPA: DinB family protein [Candidatus Limnocylindrales bacterium]|nr:DinB family protein [Candidatus Limnocylindrales bacterium]